MTFIPEFEDALVALPSVITLEALLPGGVESLDGEIYRALRHDNVEEAMEAAEAVYQEYGPEDLEAALTYGVLLLGLDGFDEALEVFRAGREAHPGRVELLLAEADCQLEQGEDAPAEALLEQFGEMADEAVDGPVWGFAGDLFLDVGMEEEAVEAYEEAVQRGTDNFETVIRLAQLHRRREEWRRAAECFEMAADLRGRVIGPWEEAAQCWKKAGNHRRALKAREHVLQARDSDAESWARQGIGLRAVGELGDAIEALEKATRLDEREPAYWIELAHTLKRAGRLERSMSAYRKVLDFEPKFVEALGGLAAAALHQGDLELAESTAREAVEIEEDNAEGWWTLGRVHLEANRADEAVVALQRAVDQNPEDIRFLQTLGQAQMEAGDREAALETFDQAVENGPEDASIAIPYAAALVRAKAWEHLADLLESPSNFREAPRWELIRPLLALFVDVFAGQEEDGEGADQEDGGEPPLAEHVQAFKSALDSHAEQVPLDEDFEEFRRFARVMDPQAKWAAETMIDGLEGVDVAEDLEI